ncbi:Uu.00g067620.m01.CDS01 [Anthostomella pinea]|uniref:Uu.00g067620.m01.CDS01 n=1 Tax=Anthostomella pinea TaxID=933095 RepID=A0AAI8VU52_9PEZI|nr:Uu.00g067620.m01.CDS01 [Anthostomella pinea]
MFGEIKWWEYDLSHKIIRDKSLLRKWEAAGRKLNFRPNADVADKINKAKKKRAAQLRVWGEATKRIREAVEPTTQPSTASTSNQGEAARPASITREDAAHVLLYYSIQSILTSK